MNYKTLHTKHYHLCIINFRNVDMTILIQKHSQDENLNLVTKYSKLYFLLFVFMIFLHHDRNSKSKDAEEMKIKQDKTKKRKLILIHTLPIDKIFTFIVKT